MSEGFEAAALAAMDQSVDNYIDDLMRDVEDRAFDLAVKMFPEVDQDVLRATLLIGIVSFADTLPEIEKAKDVITAAYAAFDEATDG